ncbi:VIT and vWA domain-containing protein [Ereboglobus luteus]|uniref:Trypsin n=1 Tax=Ereboglobus luteus TaxID=1796921 RepID=A0A2U8E119_9BACT|nr:VIT and VWA domain-containing protein [Ereboglobus luteus]AWI08516.1 hypothetical protein CKA38_03950 [Ereboglobus luteus]
MKTTIKNLSLARPLRWATFLMAMLSMLLSLAVLTGTLRAAGTLTPLSSVNARIQIREHQVNVTINNGFAQTEVLQTFFNPNGADLEAIYAFPVPKSASLSEVTIQTGEKTLHGEVLRKADAEKIYGEEKAKGNDAGLASKNGYQNYEFRVSPVRANAEVHLRFVYYQSLEIDTGVGRYLYPLEEGGTDDIASSFWQPANAQVEGRLSINVELKSAWPVEDLRSPGNEAAANIQKLDTGHWKLTLERDRAQLAQDFVLYYRLAADLPGRVEVIPYRASPDKPGTFMAVVTPGLDLQPISSSDYIFVLDISGSMQGKLATLANGIVKVLGQMNPGDRFRIITFNQGSREVFPLTAATPENVTRAIEVVQSLHANGSTNIYSGLKLALNSLDADRATSIILVTDGVTNEGIVDPRAFYSLLKKNDVRFFGFLMGSSANWPLMRVMGEATGGFYAGVSNADDIVGQILLAKSKVTHESLHHATFKFSGGATSGLTGDLPQKIYRGQQLVIFGRYNKAGPATLTLNAKLTGEDKTYTTKFNFPEVDTDNPELERLWALAQIEQIELLENIGQMPPSESKDAIADLGVMYQLVTDHTSMVVLDDATHAARGIERNNQKRIALERAAQSVRAQQPAKNYQVDAQQPTYSAPAPHVSRSRGFGGGGGGALEFRDVALMALFMLVVSAVGISRRKARKAGNLKQ